MNEKSQIQYIIKYDNFRRVFRVFIHEKYAYQFKFNESMSQVILSPNQYIQYMTVDEAIQKIKLYGVSLAQIQLKRTQQSAKDVKEFENEK